MVYTILAWAMGIFYAALFLRLLSIVEDGS
jgi:hypothetical protein